MSTSSTDSFDFVVPTRIRFGVGSRQRLPEIVAEENWRRLGVVVDHNLVDVRLVREMLDSLSAVSDELVVEPCRIQEPTYDALEESRHAFTGKHLDAIIGIGGGSALDMAKAMAVLATNLGPAISYRGFDRIEVPPLAIVAVPTTAGTGSEATPNASFIDSHQKFKMGINGEAVRPRYAVLDPELTLTCPHAPTLSAAADSLVHATEAFVAKKSNPIARLFAREGFQLVFDHLPGLLQNLDDLVLRTKVMKGAFFSGLALMHSGTGPSAALSYPLGVHYGVPHGIGGAIFLPHVVRFNVEHGVHDYPQLLGSGPADPDSGNDIEIAPSRESANSFVDNMFETWRRMGVPQQISEICTGVSADLMVDDTLKLGAALEQNPVGFGPKQLRSVLLELGVG